MASESLIVRAGGPGMTPRPPNARTRPGKAVARLGGARDPSSPRLAGRPVDAVDENLAVGRHARLRETDRAAQPQLYAHHLLDAILTEIGVLRRERRLRVDAHHVRVDRLGRCRVQVHARRLADPHAPDLALRHERPEIDL